ncbi:MAG: DUF4143 domain-containing protein, partial [Oscillospiraceae bacterium]|nr:DUF4143 domain-containing protein [Oscillospiraceae bacterium]
LSYAGHWSYQEMQDAFGFSIEEYQWFGGYPGAAVLINDEARFKEYIQNSIIEPTMIRDVLMTSKIDKPALLRQLLEVGISYSSQVVSYTKMLGQLQDAGNTTTLARYLNLLGQAGLLSGLNKYSGSEIKTKGTIPRFQVHNNALFSAMQRFTIEETMINNSKWGAVVESSVGTHLINQVNQIANASLFYWRENGTEIDFVIKMGNKIIGIEVKSGDESISDKTVNRFKERFPGAELLLIGKHGIPYEVFMKADLRDM